MLGPAVSYQEALGFRSAVTQSLVCFVTQVLSTLTLRPSLLRGGRRHSIRSAIPHGFKTSFEQRCQLLIYFVVHIIVLALEASRRPVGRPCTQESAVNEITLEVMCCKT